MPETAEQIVERARGALRTPPVEKWGTWPFVGDVTPRDLLEPVAAERPRNGEGGTECGRCAQPDDAYVWSDANWRIHTLREPSGLPVVLLMESRAHYEEPGDLPDDLAAECGVMLARVERAIRSVGEIGRVHVCRWGDGSAHLHWWFMARPARLPQFSGTFAAIWDDVLPPVPEDIWRANVDAVVRALSGDH